jgi:hypothetical protein
MSKQNNNNEKADESENSSGSVQGDGSSLADFQQDSHDSDEESLSIEDICKSIGGQTGAVEGETATPIDWSTDRLVNDPEGIDAAIARNNAIMEQKTREVIENGSLEDIAAALEENTRQLQMLHDRMQNLFKIMS